MHPDTRLDETEIDLRDDARAVVPPAPGAPSPPRLAFAELDERDEDSREFRRAGLTAVVLLALLNIVDVVTTQLLLQRGAVELNPVVSPFLASNHAVVIKLVIVGLLAVDFLRRRPRLITLCALWLVVGVYVFVVIVNGTQLVAIWDQ